MLVTDTHTLAQIVADLEALTPDDVLAIDTETTGLHMHVNDVLRGISLTYEAGSLPARQSVYISVSHPDSWCMTTWEAQRLGRAINECRALPVYHNAPFDWRALSAIGVTIPGRYWDTQVVDWLMDENLDHRLKEGVGARMFGTDAGAEKRALAALRRGTPQADIYKELRQQEPWSERGMAKAAREEAKRLHDESRRDWGTFTAEDLADYACQDTNLTFAIHESQMRDLAEPWNPDVDPRPDLEREFAFQKVLARMIDTGIRVDPKAAERHRATALERIAHIEAEFDGVNLGSVRQLQKLIYQDWRLTPARRTASGAPSTDKQALEELEGRHPGIELILEWRGLSKAVGTYYNGLLDLIGRDGRIHSAFSSTRTKTGRLSSSGPNLQNIPRADTNPEVRSVFLPEDGMELWEFDLEQAELRVMAGFAGETVMADAILNGRDLHGETAASMWGAEFTSLQRRLAKNLNFGFPYGIQARKFANYLVAGTGRPVTEAHVAHAESILASYRDTYPNLTRLMSGLAREAERLGYLPLHVPGRYRRFRGPGYIVPSYTALNAIVQGGVGEFMKDVMLALHPVIGAYGRVCLQIHDSLVIELVPGTGPLVQKVLQQIADDLSPFRYPMAWSAKQWGAAE